MQYNIDINIAPCYIGVQILTNIHYDFIFSDGDKDEAL